MMLSARRAIHMWLCMRSVDDEGAKAKKLADQHRSRQALTAFRVLAPVLWLLSSMPIWRLCLYMKSHYLDGPVPESGPGILESVLSSTEIIPLNAMAFCCAFFVWLPQHVKPRNLDLANVILAGIWIWRT